MLKKLYLFSKDKFINHNLLLSLVYGLLPLIRFPAFYYIYGGKIYIEIILFNSIFQFVPEVLTLLFDTNKKNMETEIGQIIFLLLLFIFPFFLFATIFQNIVIVLCTYLLIDNLFAIESNARSVSLNYIYQVVRLVSIYFISQFNYILLFILNIIIAVFLLKIKNPRNLDFKNLNKKEFLIGLVVVTISRSRDFLQNLIFQGLLTSTHFFIINIFQKIIFWFLSIHYSILRNRLFSISQLRIYFNIIKNLQVIFLIILLFFTGTYWYLNLFISAFVHQIFHAYENLVNQLMIFTKKDSVIKIGITNLLSVILLIFIYFEIHYMNNIKHQSIYLLITISIYFNIKIFFINKLRF